MTIVGSGNWGSAIAKIIGRNVLDRDEFDDEVRMWVYEEQVDGKNLTEIINSEHENVKYLPVSGSSKLTHAFTGLCAHRSRPVCCSLDLAQGIKFTENIIADPDLANACTDATLLVFVLPHQFLGRICPQMTTMANGCRALSLIKGIEFEEGGPILISNMIKEAMDGMDVSVLMGANVANEGERETPEQPPLRTRAAAAARPTDLSPRAARLSPPSRA